MKRLVSEVMGHAVFRDAPLVLVDIGASGGLPREWKLLAPYAVGIGFDPDSRETQILSKEQHRFRRWIFVPRVVVAEASRESAQMFLTQSPFCSSTLPPSQKLQEWAFSDLFVVERELELPAQTLEDALHANGLKQVDWLKCDTQGTDVRIFRSLSDSVRHAIHVVEFEPGLINAYTGEDKFADLLRTMDSEPFWQARLVVNHTPRGRIETLRRELGPVGASLYRDFGLGAPAWVNSTYLRDFHRVPVANIRDALAGSLLALLHRQPVVALEIVEASAGLFSEPLLARLAETARRQIRQALWLEPRRWPAILKRWWRMQH